MSKRKPIDISAFAAAARPQGDPVAKATTPEPERLLEAPSTTSKAAASSRASRVQIQGYFPAETRRRLKVLAAQEGRTIEELLGEAINELLEKRRRDALLRTN
jgi:hypothetical protein